MSNSEVLNEMLQNVSAGPAMFAKINMLGTEVHNYLEISNCDPLKHIMNNPILIVFVLIGKSIRIQRVNYSNMS